MERDTWERERAALDAGIDWMRALADRFRAARRRHPEEDGSCDVAAPAGHGRWRAGGIGGNRPEEEG